MKQLIQVLTAASSTNFALYYVSHAAHVNVVGRNFYADHGLLGDIYEDLQGQIDTYAEFLRTIDSFMPSSLKAVMKSSVISGDLTGDTADEFIEQLIGDNRAMIDCLELLYEEAEAEGEIGLSNYAQDRLIVHKKFQWQLKSTMK